MIVRVHARWVLPMATPPLVGGWVDVDAVQREIVAIGAAGTRYSTAPDHTLDLGNAAILPGLVNAHTHLELSHLAGAVLPAANFVAWVRAMLGVRFGAPTTVGDVVEAVTRAIAEAEASGTVAVGDIGNTESAIPALLESSLAGVHFTEALAFKAADAGRVAGEAMLGARMVQARLLEHRCTRIVASVAPHAPYSTSAALIQALSGGMPAGGSFTYVPPPKPARRADQPEAAHEWSALPISSIHLAESPEEVEFLRTGTGPFRDLLTDLGAWDDTWAPPGLAPVPYLQRLGVLHERLLVVHGTQLTRPELDVLAGVGATLVLCARSNRWVGAGMPPVAAAFAAGTRVAVGTDSLASVEDLNLFAELAYLHQIAPEVPAGRLLEAATRGGARALGCNSLGVLAPGATSRAIIRMPPAGVADVEQWLVADAADTADLRWLDELVAQVA
jgi:cytosine/adenosine deaminase-related metal-dependent hydrolase